MDHEKTRQLKGVQRVFVGKTVYVGENDRIKHLQIEIAQLKQGIKDLQKPQQSSGLLDKLLKLPVSLFDNGEREKQLQDKRSELAQYQSDLSKMEDKNYSHLFTLD